MFSSSLTTFLCCGPYFCFKLRCATLRAGNDLNLICHQKTPLLSWGSWAKCKIWAGAEQWQPHAEHWSCSDTWAWDVAQTEEFQACSGAWKLETVSVLVFVDYKIPLLAGGVCLVGCSVVVLQGLILAWTLHWWQRASRVNPFNLWKTGTLSI